VFRKDRPTNNLYAYRSGLNDCLPVDSFEHVMSSNELASAYVGYSGMLNVQWDQLRVIRLLMGRVFFILFPCV
jgi:hypothetical protein